MELDTPLLWPLSPLSLLQDVSAPAVRHAAMIIAGRRFGIDLSCIEVSATVAVRALPRNREPHLPLPANLRPLRADLSQKSTAFTCAFVHDRRA